MNARHFAIALLLTFGAIALTRQADQAPPVDFSKFKPYTSQSDEGDYLLVPPYTNAVELIAREGVPHGEVTTITLDSHDSKFFPGIAKTKPGEVVPYTRRVTVYIPKQYKSGTRLPFVISADSMGFGYLPTALDNMIADGRIPVMGAIMMDSGGGDAQGSERGLEYDTMSGKFAEYVEAEVLPRVEKDFNVMLSKNPDERITMGGSSGGACAMAMAWYHPDLYHKVISYSGTFVNQQSPLDPKTPRGAWEFHATLVPTTRRKPLRIWMHVGETDIRYKDPESTWHNWVLANNRMAAALKSKGYHYQYVFARESGHVDGRVVRQTMPQAIEWIWKGWKKNR